MILLQLEGLKAEYESQLNSLQEELGRQGQSNISEQTIRDMFQQVGDPLIKVHRPFDKGHNPSIDKMIFFLSKIVYRKGNYF